MVSGTDEHGTPIQVQADKEGVTPRELADRNALVIAKDLQQPRAVLRPVHPHDDEEPLRDHAGDLPGPAQERLHLPADAARRDQPVHRPHPAGPLHRGHLPDLRLPARARRPVRQLRQPARPDRPDRAAQSKINGETPQFVEIEQMMLDLPAFAEVLAEWLRKQDHWRTQRAEVQPQPARRPQAALVHPRPGVGHPGAAGRLARPAGQVDLRLVRRRRRLPVGLDRVGAAHRRPGRVAAVVAGPGLARLLLHGQGQHRLPRRDLAGDAVRLLRHRRQGRRAGFARRAATGPTRSCRASS